MEKQDTQIRDQLAVFRTHLANERTLLAYLRTAIMSFISGLTLVKLYDHVLLMLLLGYFLVLLSFSLALMSYSRFRMNRKKIDIESLS